MNLSAMMLIIAHDLNQYQYVPAPRMLIRSALLHSGGDASCSSENNIAPVRCLARGSLFYKHDLVDTAWSFRAMRRTKT